MNQTMVANEELLKGLNEDLAAEWAAIMRYTFQSAKALGLRGAELREILEKELPDELGHARRDRDEAHAQPVPRRGDSAPDVDAPAFDGALAARACASRLSRTSTSTTSCKGTAFWLRRSKAG